MNPLIHPALGVKHGFFTREGGVSCGLFESLNCGLGSADAPEYVEENRRRVAAWFSKTEVDVVSPRQSHSARVAVIGGPGRHDRPEADALVSAAPGVVVGVLTADCAPVLLADTTSGVVGAAHAGWRGALDGVLDATVTTMTSLGADKARIVAVIGPCISRDAYEVGQEFVARFVAASRMNKPFFSIGQNGKSRFDLRAFCRSRLTDAGIVTVGDIDQCTYLDYQRFFSYRRSIHGGERDYGRHLSAISPVAA